MRLQGEKITYQEVWDWGSSTDDDDEPKKCQDAKQKEKKSKQERTERSPFLRWMGLVE